MIVEKTAAHAKKSLAVTLALALGLSLPGGAWSQVIGPRVAPVGAVGAEAATAYAGAQAATLPMPVSGGFYAPAPTLTAPLAAPAASLAAVPLAAAQGLPIAAPAAAAAPVAMPAAVEAHPVISLINQLQKAGVALPDNVSSHADAARIEEAARVLPEGSGTRAQLTQLAAAIRASHAAPAGDASGKIFDGSKGGAESSAAPVAAAPTGWRAAVARLLPSSVAKVVGAQKDAPTPQPIDPKSRELSVNEVRYAPVAEKLPASTREIPLEEQRVIGQDDALKAIRFALEMKPDHYNLFVAGGEGGGRSMALRRILSEIAPKMKTPNDVVAATNFDDKDNPVFLEFAPGQGAKFEAAVEGFVEAMKENLPVALSSGEIGQQKKQVMAQVQAAQAKMQAEFDAKIASIKLAGKFGVKFMTQPTEQGVSIMIPITWNGEGMSKEEVDAHIKAGDFSEAEWKQAQAELTQKKSGMLEAFQAMMQAQMEMMKKIQGMVEKLDRQAVIGLVNQYANELASIATAGPATKADEEFQKRAEERDAEINEEAHKIARAKYGKFNAAIQVGMGEDGPVVVALPALGQLPLAPEIAAKLIAAGKITQAEYDEAKAAIEKKAAALQEKAREMLALTQKEHAALQASKPAPGPEAAKVHAYVQQLAEYAAENYKVFLGIKEGAEGIKPMPGSRPLDPEDFFRVSVLSDNSDVKGAPVVWEENPTYERLFGSADGNQRNMVIPGVGIVKADGPGGPTFKAGSFMKANGGFLVLRAMDVLRNPGVWPALMHAVRTGQAEIAEGGFMGMASMKGDIYHVPAKVKVVLVGSPMIQMLLAQHDEDFALNFQGVAHFQSTIKITGEAVDGFLNFIKHSVVGSAGQIMDLTRSAIERVLEFAARQADSNKYFTAQFGALHGLMQEASYAAQQAGRTEVRGEDVDAAIAAKQDREEVHYKRMAELVRDNTFRIDTTGSVVGQGNGLAVMGSKGAQMRVTAVATAGQPGIFSTDRDAGSTGSSFNKALGNVWSLLAHRYGQEAPVLAHIRLSYEQNYGGIDGDSATSTEFYTIASALSGVPIKQQFAYTGSADAFGNVQAIGGVNEKIEGFFDLCESRGLTGDQGVVIPRTNVKDLQLKPAVVEAIRQGKFHIYAVDTVDQGLEIITGVSSKVIDQKVQARLAEIAKQAKGK